MSDHKVSEGEITADVRRLARLLGHSPSSVEYARHGGYDLSTVRRRFRLPWRLVVEAAGLRYTPRTSSRIPTTEELRRDVCRVTREVGRPPTRAEYGSRGRFDPETVRRRSGRRRWEEAVAWLTGADPEEVKGRQQRGGRYRTTAEWLSRLRDLSRRLGRAPTTGEANGAGINAQELRRRVGGGWPDVLMAAGISLGARGRRAALLATSTESMMEDVAAVARRLGRVPAAREYESHGRYPYAVVGRRVGGWRQVKKILAGDTGACGRDKGLRPPPAEATSADRAAAAEAFPRRLSACHPRR